MYSVSTRLLKIPTDVTALRKFTSIGSTCNILAVTNKPFEIKRYQSTDKSYYSNSQQYSYKYLCYSLLIGAAAYTSYKFW